VPWPEEPLLGFTLRDDTESVGVGGVRGEVPPADEVDAAVSAPADVAEVHAECAAQEREHASFKGGASVYVRV
jgi:hypothetical protein